MNITTRAKATLLRNFSGVAGVKGFTPSSGEKPLPCIDPATDGQTRAGRVQRKLGLVITSLGLALLLAGEAMAQTTFAGNAQHTAIYSPTAQSLNTVHWTAPIDLNNTGALAHYGAPLITSANTIVVPVKTGATGGFEINVYNAATGSALYTLATDYTLPAYSWIPVYQPVLVPNSVETQTRLYYPGNGGTIYYIENVDSPGHGTPVQQVFYTTLGNYQANAAAFNSTVFINTPITADSNGNVFFGFRVNGTAPAPLSTTQSGFARIDPNGNATYVLAGTAAGDASVGYDTDNCPPGAEQRSDHGICGGEIAQHGSFLRLPARPEFHHAGHQVQGLPA